MSTEPKQDVPEHVENFYRARAVLKRSIENAVQRAAMLTVSEGLSEDDFLAEARSSYMNELLELDQLRRAGIRRWIKEQEEKKIAEKMDEAKISETTQQSNEET
jgi:hypothetical protein